MMTEVKGKILKFRFDKYSVDGMDTYDDHFTCRIVNSKFEGTLKESIKSDEFRVILKVNKDTYDKALYENIESSLMNIAKISNRGQLGELKDTLHDQYRFYYVVNKIFEILDEKEGHLEVDDGLEIRLDRSTAESVKTFSFPHDVDKFIRLRESLPKMPEKGEWSETIKWVPN